MTVAYVACVALLVNIILLLMLMLILNVSSLGG